MKLIVFAVLSIAVFRASCRERPSDRHLNYDDFYLKKSTGLPHETDFTDSWDQNNGGNIHSELQDEASPPGDDIIASTIDMEAEYYYDRFPNNDSSINDHRMKEVETVQNKGLLRGGPKCKPEIVCSLLGGACITSTADCRGREVPSVCGAKCKCCITVNLEVRMHDLETELRSMVVNLTVANSNLNTKLESLMDYMISSNSSQAMLNTDLDRKIDSIMSSNSNFSRENHDLNRKIDSIISANLNLSNANSKMKNALDYFISNVTNANANQETMLNSIKEQQGCPEGFFLFAETGQCFRFLNDTRRNFDQAKAACKALGLDLAIPYEPVAFRNFIVMKFGSIRQTWVDVRGDGKALKWLRTGQTIHADSPLWWPEKQPGKYFGTDICSAQLNGDWWWYQQPIRVYHIHHCRHATWTICELVDE